MGDLLVRFITALVGLPLFVGSYFLSKNLFSILLFAILLVIGIFEWPKFCKNRKTMWLLFPVYPAIPLFSLFYLNHFYRDIDILLPLYPFFASWSADVGGYLVGRFWGKNKICPDISPKKSWEGLLGSFLFVFVANVFLVSHKRLIFLLFYSAFIALVALIGDLFESYLKRMSKLKDSGGLLPGHGGFLDRFDSVFFVGFVNFLMLFASSRLGWKRFL